MAPESEPVVEPMEEAPEKESDEDKIKSKAELCGKIQAMQLALADRSPKGTEKAHHLYAKISRQEKLNTLFWQELREAAIEDGPDKNILNTYRDCQKQLQSGAESTWY